MEFCFSETLVIDKHPGIHLLQDHIGTNYDVPWDDFSYVITFQAYNVSKEGEKIKIGLLKVLHKNEQDTSVYFKKTGERLEPRIFRINKCLNDSMLVSIGKDLDYYKRIHSLFVGNERELVLQNLCDVSFLKDNHELYSQWDGYSGSLMRGSSSSAILKKGYSIAIGRYNPTTKFELKIENVGENFDPITFKFNMERKIGKSNISLLIGKNGVGKTHILKKITEIITGVSKEEENFPFFHKLVVIAYSPFEEFYTEKELFNKINSKYTRGSDSATRKSLKRQRLHVNEYSYIGFRNEEGVFSREFPSIKSIDSILKIISYDKENEWWTDKSRLNILIETLKLSIDFDSINITDKSGNKIEVNDRTNLKNAEKIIDYEKGLTFVKDQKILSLSSGQKIYTYMLPSIISEIEDESLLILDEPELYLHPALEVGLINMLKNILNETKSFSLIATHSSIMTREVERNAVTILRKKNKNTNMYKPSIETYGESIDVIISEVFDDEYIRKPYENEIDKVLGMNPSSISEIKDFIGDDALAYALSRSEDDKLTFEDDE